MKVFNGTKGLVTITEAYSGVEQLIIDEEGFQIAVTTGEYKGGPALALENSNLIVNAFNTISKCNIIPSELLNQRNELLKALQKARLALILLGIKKDSPMIKDIDKAINKAL